MHSWQMFSVSTKKINIKNKLKLISVSFTHSKTLLQIKVPNLRFLYLIIYILFATESFGQQLHLKIHGEDDKATAIIDSLSYNTKHNNLNALNNEIATTQQRLSKLGYIENTLESLKKINDTTFHSAIELNTKFNTIYIYYSKTGINESQLQLLSDDITPTYFSIPISKTETVLQELNNRIANDGYPFATLQLQNVTKQDNNNLKADLTISTPKRKRFIDDIIVKGYKKFPKTYLKHFLNIKKGQVFNLETVKRKTEQLNNLIFAEELKSPEVLFTKDSTTLYLYLKKRKSNNFDGFLGFGTNETTNKLEFTGYLNLVLNNNLNFGEALNFQYRSDENDQQQFNVNIDLPYLFNTPIGTSFQLDIFRRDSTFNTTTQSAKLYYQINARSKFAGGINSSKSENLLKTNTFDNLKDYSSTFYTLGYNYIKRELNNRLFRANFVCDIELGVGNRKDSTKTTQQSARLNTFKIIKLNRKNNVYLRLNGAGLFSDQYLQNELYRFGGINSIRGFEENSINANLYGVLNTEYRYIINPNLYLHSIIDVAYFENDIISQKEKLYGFGFGFGLLTKAGVLKFNYANGKNENENFKFSDSKIHLSLTAFF